MIRRPPRSTLDRSSAASDVYKRQMLDRQPDAIVFGLMGAKEIDVPRIPADLPVVLINLSLIHISEPTRPY